MSARTDIHWFIDAWAVHDGRVFASRRRRDSIDAETTVFMSVPDLQPIPVGRISTARRGTRSGFQDGFRVGDAEVAFDSLKQVRALTRLAYLASELGPEAPGAQSAPIPGPEIDSGPGAAYVDAAFERLELQELPSSEIPLFAPLGIDAAVSVLALGSLLEWDTQLEDQLPDVVRAFGGWAWMLKRTGAFDGSEEASWILGGPTVGPDLAAVESFANRSGAYNVARACASLLAFIPRGLYEFGDWFVEASWSRAHLAVVPLPRHRCWDHRVRRMVEMHTLPIVDRRFARRMSWSYDLAAFALVGMLRSGPSVGQLPGEQSAAQRGFELAARGAGREALPEEAEQALENFVDDCLDGVPVDAGPAPRSSPGADTPVPAPAPSKATGAPSERSTLDSAAIQTNPPARRAIEVESGRERMGYA